MAKKHRVFKRGGIQYVSDWEDIPESEKPKVDAVGIAKQVVSNDWEQARKAAQEDAKKRFGK